MTTTMPFPIPPFHRLSRIALTVGVIALAVCIIGAVFTPAQFFRSYLVGYLLWSGVAFGCFALVMLHHLVGGGWGFLVRRLLESGTRTWPLLAVLTIPLLFGLPWLYAWAHADQVAQSELLRHRRPYLNIPFFLARLVLYFGVWAFLAKRLNKWSAEQDTSADPDILRRLQNLSGPGIILYGLTVTFASMDWGMSLEQEWFSTAYSAIFMMGQAVSGLAFVIALVYLLARTEPIRSLAVPKYLNDLGNMLLAFVMLWAYIQFGQFLIVWSENLTDEIPWYFHRSQNGWQIVALVLFVFHFAVPFVLLLGRNLKRRVALLSSLAVAMIAFRLLDMFWTVEPAFDRAGLRFHWMDWVAPIGIGGIWIAAFLREAQQRPLLPALDPRLPKVYERIAARRVGDV